MTAIENDLDYLREGTGQFKDYLLSDELFWPMGGRQVPELTPGNLLLARARLQARSLDEGQQNAFADLNAQLSDLRSQWRTAWAKKIGREFTARLRQWGHTLDDLAKDKDKNYFENEVRVRVLLELLKGELQVSEAEIAVLKNLDERLRTQFAAGDFIWETDLQPGFPKEQYWFLYGGMP